MKCRHKSKPHRISFANDREGEAPLFFTAWFMLYIDTSERYDKISITYKSH